MIPLLFKSRREKLSPSMPLDTKTNILQGEVSHSLLGYASVTNKATDESNQDAVAVLRNNSLHFNALIVADGIGGLRYGREAAQIAVSAAKESLSDGQFTGIREVFAKSQLALYKGTKPLVKSEELSEFGTTLIVAIETVDRLIIGYLGNGSIWHIRANFNECCSESRAIPWCAINLLNPHSIERGGREVLTGFVSPTFIHEPTIIELSKDKYVGDILILSSDGMSSQDQVQFGKDANEEYWSRAEIWLPQLLTKLATYLAETDLSTIIYKFLNNLKEKNTLDDDTTVAMLVTPAAAHISATSIARTMQKA